MATRTCTLTKRPDRFEIQRTRAWSSIRAKKYETVSYRSLRKVTARQTTGVGVSAKRKSAEWITTERALRNKNADNLLFCYIKNSCSFSAAPFCGTVCSLRLFRIKTQAVNRLRETFRSYHLCAKNYRSGIQFTASSPVVFRKHFSSLKTNLSTLAERCGGEGERESSGSNC